MELANCFVALGGDEGTLVQKYGVTPAEVAVLEHIHGSGAVTEIQVFGAEVRRSRDERERLCQIYGVNNEGQITARAVDALFPGVASRLFETFDELGMDPAAFAEPIVVAAPKKGRKKAEAAPAEQAAPEPEEDDFEDMPKAPADVMG